MPSVKSYPSPYNIITEAQEAAQRIEDNKHRNKDRIVTVLVAAVTGATGVIAGTLSHGAGEHADQKARFEIRAFDKAMDADTPVAMYRVDNLTGDVWFPRRRTDGTVDWILIGGATPRPKETSALATTSSSPLSNVTPTPVASQSPSPK